MRIALAGNPNSGKTTMYNALTGCNEKVGNWAGVTVDKKEHPLKKAFCGKSDKITAVDLPGAYSMSPFTSEESVTSDYVRNAHPNAIINIVDATNLSRSLFFTTQLLELGIPMVVALNKTDLNKKKHNSIDIAALSKALGCPVVETVSTSSKGIADVMKAVLSVVGTIQTAPYTEGAIDHSNKDAVIKADKKRFDFVNSVVDKVEIRHTFTKDKTFGDKIDSIITSKWVGIPIFAVIMYAVFWISQAGPAVWLADWLTSWLEKGKDLVAQAVGAEKILGSILVDGIIGGVIAVVGFLPLVMVMYFLIALLEDCGYMARASVVLDPIFKKVGLSGKSVIPFIIGTGCAVPGVMACRTIRNERERKATAMLAPFMPCGAKLPVIALFAGVFFPGSKWVGASMYFVGIAIILVCALIINKITGYKHRKSFFIIELPEYKAPDLLKAFVSMCQRGWSYIVKAGTIILVCNFIVHIMQKYNWSFQPAADAGESILSTIATPFGYAFAPIVGFVSWQLAAAAITGFIAKENVVGTLAVCFGISNLISLDFDTSIAEGANLGEISAAFGTGSGNSMFAIAALSYLMFNLFTPPCFAAIGAMNAELKSKKWLFAGIGLQLAVGYTISFLLFFFGSLFTDVGFASVWMPILGWCIVAVAVLVITSLIIKNNREMKSKYALKTTA